MTCGARCCTGLGLPSSSAVRSPVVLSSPLPLVATSLNTLLEPLDGVIKLDFYHVVYMYCPAL